MASNPVVEEKKIDTTLVTVGAPTEGGCVYVCFDENPTLPEDATSELGASWSSCGDISPDGFTISHSVTSTNHKDWNGDTVLTTIDEETDTFKLAFIEVNRLTAAKIRYGANNVTAGADGSVAHISSKSAGNQKIAFVVEELESNGFKRRTVVKCASASSFDDEAHVKSGLLAYGITFTATKIDGATYDVYRAKPASA